MAHITHELLEGITAVLVDATGDYATQLGQIKDILQTHIDQVDVLEAQALEQISNLNTTDLMALTHKNRILN
jgi:hypothetical protein